MKRITEKENAYSEQLFNPPTKNQPYPPPFLKEINFLIMFRKTSKKNTKQYVVDRGVEDQKGSIPRNETKKKSW